MTEEVDCSQPVANDKHQVGIWNGKASKVDECSRFKDV